MNNLYKLTKEELILKCKRLQSENENLQDELNSLSDCYTEMENLLAEKINALDGVETIKDIRMFKFRLQLDNLWTRELEYFIENYMKYYNEIWG